MGQPLRVLIIEDSEDDALLVLRALKRGGYELIHERVDNAEDLRRCLRVPSWDVIICDYVLPSLKVSDALALCREKGISTPFIVISGVYGAYIAAHTIQAGAHEYIAKGDLGALVEAVRRLCNEAESARKKEAPPKKPQSWLSKLLRDSALGSL